MATTTFNAPYATTSADVKKSGWLSRLSEQFIAERTAKGRRIAAERVAMYTDEQLLRFGWSEQDIKRLRNIA